MFKKFLGGGKKEEPKQAPPKVDDNVKYEKTLYDINSRISKIDDDMDRIDERITKLDTDIRQFIA